MSSFLTHFQEDGCTNLYRWVRDVPPTFVCSNPKVTHDGGKGVSPLIINANIYAIKRAWSLARGIGMASLIYDKQANQLLIKPGIITTMENPIGQVGKGLIETARRNETNPNIVIGRESVPVGQFYGLQSYMEDIGIPIISYQLVWLIMQYVKMQGTIIHRVENSYGSMTSLEGLDMGDQPLVEAVQNKINADWDKSRRMMAPGGSKLGEVDIALTDTDKMLVPLEDSIAVESGIPRRLLFPNKTSSQFELEEISIWARQLFETHVTPALYSILEAQGYKEIGITTPSYRDANYDATVENLISDTKYKNSASAKNSAAVKVLKEGGKAPTSNMGRQL